MKEAEDVSEFGAALRRAREARQLSIEAASRACMLSDRQIIGLESADYRAFYSCEYARRGAQRYAQFLDVPNVPNIERISDEGQEGSRRRNSVSLIKLPRRGRLAAWPLLLLSFVSVCALVAALLLWDRHRLALKPLSSDALQLWHAGVPMQAVEITGAGAEPGAVSSQPLMLSAQFRTDPIGSAPSLIDAVPRQMRME
ncbi:MAG TPA: helix-turn-helix domain-containing protein [Steroidobacter sp.]